MRSGTLRLLRLSGGSTCKRSIWEFVLVAPIGRCRRNMNSGILPGHIRKIQIECGVQGLVKTMKTNISISEIKRAIEDHWALQLGSYFAAVHDLRGATYNLGGTVTDYYWN